MDLDVYLARIGYDGPREPTLDVLRAMQRAHFLNVPFENMDISMGTRIVVDEAVNFAKVVHARRGGWCLELNGLFVRALRKMGFAVDILGGRGLTPDGQMTAPLSHMTLLVHLDEPWIADVGFSGRLAGPLRLHERGIQTYGVRRYAVANDGDRWFVTANEPGHIPGSAPITYVFSLQPRDFDEFHEVCGWLQTSPDSRFTRGPFVTLASDTGRATLAAGRLIVTDGESRSERALTSNEEERAVLKERFGIAI